MPVLSKAQGEYDDLYYTPADRESAKQEYRTKVKFTPQSNDLADNSSYNVKTPSVTAPSIYNDRINNTSQGRTVNPEYVAQYRSRSDARNKNYQKQEEVYFDENYQTEYYDDDNGQGNVINNYNYYGSNWSNPYYDPFYVNDWRWRYNDWRWRRASWYHDPYWSMTPGWSVNISFGWGHHHHHGYYGYGHRWSRWSYDPWYSPYYAGGYYYNSFYNPYWNAPIYSSSYYNNVVYVNNDYISNNSIRRGPATSRGSVINTRRSVASEGPVRRVPVKRSSLDGGANGRVGSPTTVSSGRVIERSTINRRTARDYNSNSIRGRESAIERTDRGDRRYVPVKRTSPQRNSVDRSNNSRTTNPAYQRSNSDQRKFTIPNRSETKRDNSNRRYTPSRGNDNDNRYTPSRSNRDNNSRYTPQRSNSNNRYTPSRSSDNNRSGRSSNYRAPSQPRSQPSYSPPQRSSSPSYDRGGGSSSRGSMTPSRSSSSPSRGTSGSSSRRGGR